MTGLSVEGPHWSFALRLYGSPGASESCLALQDRFGVDVNVLLFAFFAAVDRGLALETSDIAEMDRAVAEWRREIVLPLRSIRRRMKSGPDPAPSEITERLRDQIKRAEISAEQIEQAVLARWLDQRHGGPAQREVDLAALVTRIVGYYREPTSGISALADVSDVDGLVQPLLRAAENMRPEPHA